MAVDIGQTALETIVIVSEALMVQAHEVQDSGIEIVNGGATSHRFKTRTHRSRRGCKPS